MVLFKGTKYDPQDLESVVFTALGAASVCWDGMEGTGEFQSGRAKEIGDDVINWINEHYDKKNEDGSIWQPLPAKWVQWNKNGDHPGDHVGKREIDWVKLYDLRPDLLAIDQRDITDDDVPGDAYYERLEGEVVRFFNRPESEFAGHRFHSECGYRHHEHGWIDDGSADGEGIAVCPNSYVSQQPPYVVRAFVSKEELEGK